MKLKPFLAACSIFMLPLGAAQAQTGSSEEIHAVVEQRAGFPGDSLSSFLNHNLRYPEAARKKGAEGKVFIEMVVASNGAISGVRVVRSSGFPELDKEAVRVTQLMPAWKPARINGRNVASLYRQPITFRLN